MFIRRKLKAVLNAHPEVFRSAVVGRAIDGDEEVVAFVQPQPGSVVTRDDLSEYASLHLAAYKRPARILLVSAMPVTPTGKIVKGELRKLAEENHSGIHELARLPV